MKKKKKNQEIFCTTSPMDLCVSTWPSDFRLAE